MRSARALAAVLTLVAALGAPLTTSLVAPAAADTTASAATAAVAFTDADGIHVLDANRVDAREWALDLSTPALGDHAVRLRVLLPSDYADPAETSTRYPVLYLFHGTSGGPDDWIDAGDAEQTTAGLPLIVVLPDAGFDNDGGGWFTNWWDKNTALGPSNWETFHIGQLIPFIDANLRTDATRAGRAIAGLSQGGFGAFSYAARHPDLFAVAGSFSGAPDITSDPVIEAGATGVIEGTAVALDQVEPAAMFGPHVTNELNWQGHDPTRLITNLRGMGLDLYTATGLPGELDTTLDPPPPAAPSLAGVPLSAMGIEFLTHISTLGFAAHAKAAGLPYYLDDYVFGTHTFPYWARDLRDFVPRMMDAFAHPAADPSTVSYRSVDTTWTQWGWTVANHRAARLAWSALSDASAAGFTLSGAGSADVTTPADYAPGSVHQVRVGSATAQSLTADASGALHVSVTLHGALTPTGTVTVSIN
jgi:S-formylglutathione hydrolase FrmB